jgi:hypothetical protein
MEVNGKNAWILEAKAPNESVVKSAHVEQAYSYAIHSEIRVKYFALCNGKEFALYAIGEPKMLVLHFPIQALPRYWEMIKSRLAPDKVYLSTKKINKDLGLHLKRLGFTNFESIVFIKVLAPFIARMGPDLFSFSSGTTSEGEVYCATFDFNLATANQLKGLIPQAGFDILMKPFDGTISKIVFGDTNISFNINAIIGEKLEENEDEIFLPLKLKNFIR